MLLEEIAEKNGIVIDDCEQLWTIKSACKFFVVRDGNTGKGNLIGVGTEDDICFKNLKYSSEKGSILCVEYDKKEKYVEGEDVDKYAFIDTKTGKIIAQGKNLYTGNPDVDDDIEKFMRYSDFIGTYVHFKSKTFERAPKFIKKAKKVIKAVLYNCVENIGEVMYLYNPFTNKCDNISFKNIEECNLYINAVLYKLQSKTKEYSSRATRDYVNQMIDNAF